jgi:hypothetical protein
MPVGLTLSGKLVLIINIGVKQTGRRDQIKDGFVSEQEQWLN